MLPSRPRSSFLALALVIVLVASSTLASALPSLSTLTVEPQPPTNLQAAAGPEGKQITLAWTPSASADVLGYHVWRKSWSWSDTWQMVRTINGASTAQWTDTGASGWLMSDTGYYYYLVAFTSSAESQPSNTAFAKTFPPPNPPTNMQATAGPNGAEITLTWQPPTPNSPASLWLYQIYRSTDGSPYSFTYHAQVSSNVLSYVDRNLPPSTTYWYYVEAFGSAGHSGYNNIDAATTYALPGTPFGLQATTGPGAGEVTVSWNTPSSQAPVTHYNVYRASTPTGSFALNAQVNAPSTIHKDGGEAPGVSWCYKVSAVSTAGEGSAAGPVCAATIPTPTAPTNLRAAPLPNHILLTWERATAPAQYPILAHNIYRGETSGAEDFRWSIPGDQNFFIDNVGGPGLTFFYQVAAQNMGGVGPRSNEASATTPFGAAGLSLPAVGEKRTVENASTPYLAPVPVNGTEVRQDAACQDRPECDEATLIRDEQRLREAEDVYTPPLYIRVCDPVGLICLGDNEIPPQYVTTIPPIDTPRVEAPALCDVAAQFCVENVLVPGGTIITTPEQEEIRVTEDLVVSVSTTGFDFLLNPRVGQIGTFGPIYANQTLPPPIGSFPIVLCPNGCTGVVPPGFEYEGALTVRVTYAGTILYEQTIPVSGRV